MKINNIFEYLKIVKCKVIVFFLILFFITNTAHAFLNNTLWSSQHQDPIFPYMAFVDGEIYGGESAYSILEEGSGPQVKDNFLLN